MTTKLEFDEALYERARKGHLEEKERADKLLAMASELQLQAQQIHARADKNLHYLATKCSDIFGGP